jgi:hypothetical protein
MTIWVTAAIVAVSTVAGAGISAASARKQGKKSREAMQEQKYIEGAAPYLPGAGEIEIDEEGNLVAGSDISAILDAIKYEEGGEQLFELLQENPEVMAHLKEGLSPENLPQVMAAVPGIMEQGIMTAARGGAVGAPKDVYYFSVPNIQQMMGDPDAQVQNVGNAMMGQLEGNPGQGMVGATPGQIQQMARGGRVRR